MIEKIDNHILARLISVQSITLLIDGYATIRLYTLLQSRITDLASPGQAASVAMDLRGIV